MFISFTLFSNSNFKAKRYIYDKGSKIGGMNIEILGEYIGSFYITENGIEDLDIKKSKNKEDKFFMLEDLIKSLNFDIEGKYSFNIPKNMRKEYLSFFLLSYDLQFLMYNKILLSEEEKKYIDKSNSYRIKRDYFNEKIKKLSEYRDTLRYINGLKGINGFLNIGNGKFYLYKYNADKLILKFYDKVELNSINDNMIKGIFKSDIIKNNENNDQLYKEYKKVPWEERFKKCYFELSFSKNDSIESDKYLINLLSYMSYLFDEKKIIVFSQSKEEKYKKIEKNNEERVNFIKENELYFKERKEKCNNFIEMVKKYKV